MTAAADSGFLPAGEQTEISQSGGAPATSLRIGCLIDSLHCGGAQRQMCYLAQGLHQLGHQVIVAVYYPELNHFEAEITGHSIEVVRLSKSTGFSLARAIKNLARDRQLDWIISFLNGPNLYACLAKAMGGKFRLCVGERSANLTGFHNWKDRWFRGLYRFADRITTNSSFQADFLIRHYPAYAGKTHVIRNGVSERFFSQSALPALEQRALRDAAWDFHNDWLAVVGQISPWKNLHGLVAALVEFQKHYGSPPRIRWAGRIGEGQEKYFQQSQTGLLAANLAGTVEFVGHVDDIQAFLMDSAGLLHPSILEGYPNAACEAMTLGLPVLIGDVSDCRRFVSDGRGFAFDPSRPREIADALHQYVRKDWNQRVEIGRRCREFANREFRISAMARQYERLLMNLDKAD